MPFGLFKKEKKQEKKLETKEKVKIEFTKEVLNELKDILQKALYKAQNDIHESAPDKTALSNETYTIQEKDGLQKAHGFLYIVTSSRKKISLDELEYIKYQFRPILGQKISLNDYRENNEFFSGTPSNTQIRIKYIDKARIKASLENYRNEKAENSNNGPQAMN